MIWTIHHKNHSGNYSENRHEDSKNNIFVWMPTKMRLAPAHIVYENPLVFLIFLCIPEIPFFLKPWDKVLSIPIRIAAYCHLGVPETFLHSTLVSSVSRKIFCFSLFFIIIIWKFYIQFIHFQALFFLCFWLIKFDWF